MAFKKDVQIHLTELTPDQTSDRRILQPPTTQEQPPLVEWPSNPQSLTNEPLVDRFLDAYDVTLCVVPLLLIAKIILVIVVWHGDKSSTGSFVDEVGLLTTFLIQFNSQLTTGFTIVFVLIISTLMRRLALWKAQHGESVAQLEQFQASISLPSTLKTIWSLRAFSLTSLGLAVIWSFYYLGSQASQREFEFVNSNSYKRMSVASINPQAPSVFMNASRSTLSASQRMSLNQAYTLAVQSRTQSSRETNGYDLNGNAIVPWFGQSYPSLPNPDRHGWYDVHKASDQTPSSYAGSPMWVPESNLDSYDGYSNFSMQTLGKYTFNTSYLVANCSSPSLANVSAFPSGTLPMLSMSLNMTTISDRPQASQDNSPRTLNVWSRFGSKAVHVLCSMTMTYVQVQVRCDATACLAQKMRPTAGSPPSYQTPFDDDQFASFFFNEFLLSSGRSASMDNTSLALQYSGLPETPYDDPREPFVPDDYEVTWPMTSSINAYYQLSQNPFTTAEGDYDALNQAMTEMLAGKQTNYSSSFSVTEMKGAPYYPHYSLSIPWIIVDLISCKILFAAAIACFWLRKRTIAPDIFGYVSSLTRDNPNLHLPDGGTTLSGLERARLLKDVRICIADVGPSEGVGRVGLSYARSDSWQQEHLTREKHYI